MSAHYSKFFLNSYSVMPYFHAHVPPDYPLDEVLVKSRAFRRLPPRLRELAALAKRWARQVNPPAGIDDIDEWYDDEGYELKPGTGERLTAAEIDADWPEPDEALAAFKVEDIPLPPGGFADPDTWEEPPPPPEEPDPDVEGPPTREQLLRDIESHGYARTADEYGIPIDRLPRSNRRDQFDQRSRRALSINEGGPPEVTSALQTLPKRVHVAREWDALRSCVVGRGDNDVLPAWYPSFRAGDSNEVDDPGAAGETKAEYDPEMAARAVDQQDALAKLLEGEGVQVFRPPLLSTAVAQADPVGLSQAWMREVFTVFGSKVVLGQMRAPHRNKEAQALEPLLRALERAGAATVHRPPAASLEKNPDWVGDARPFLEGGDVFRLGKDVLVTMSYLATSPAGYRWLAELLAPDDVEVWPAYLTRDWEHGDYVFMPVREGLCVAYRRGFVDGLLPSPVTDWDCIDLTREEADDRFAANGVVLREGVVLLPKGCRRVVRALERKGVDVVEVPYDGPMHWQGGIDCSLSELWREG